MRHLDIILRSFVSYQTLIDTLVFCLTNRQHLFNLDLEIIPQHFFVLFLNILWRTAELFTFISIRLFVRTYMRITWNWKLFN